MLELKQVSLARGANTLLSDANACLYPKQRIGLTGANGSGKSTLLALIRGEMDSDKGDVAMPTHWQIASVRQETPALDISALDYVLAGHQPYQQAQQALQRAQSQQQGIAIAKAHEAFASADGYALPAKAANLLHGLGFASSAHDQAVKTFSGGWRMRLNLAQALIAPTDILLLDEPTNHLDLDAVIWLQDFLRHHPVAQIIIAHDRDFLDALCQQIWHIEQQQLHSYTGNYSAFERQRHERRAQADAVYAKESARRAHLQSYVDRFRAKATKARQAQSRLKALEKLSAAPPPPPEQRYQLHFTSAEHLPNPLVSVNHADIGYNQQALLTNIHLSFDSQARVGLLGRNGAGKSTFMKLLANVLAPLSGNCNHHRHTRIGYFTQHQLDALNHQQSARQHLSTLHPDMNEQAQRNFLGGYGFSGERADQIVAQFSGGEKARLALALIISQRPNLLLLDEPTNHLDLAMRDALSEALQSYNGAMVIISHDRSLLRATCDDFYLIDSGKVTPFDGDLDDYHQYLTQHQQPNASPPKSQANRQQQRRAEADKRKALQPLTTALKKAEQRIEQLNSELQTIEQRLSDSSLYDSDNKATLLELLNQQSQLKQSLEQSEQDWLERAQALEDAQA